MESKDWVSLGHMGVSTLTGLQTSKSMQRLNQIDRVRAKGLGDHLSLPQLAVCGEQSAGKSSVLEGITGIPFPRQDGVCTRFATEIVLRHQPGANRMRATIIPSNLRSKDEKLRMKSFERQLVSYDELPTIIQKASVLMGIASDTHASSETTTSFAADVLRLEVVGDTGLQLTVVDLPGLISVAENEDDLKMVGTLVDGYLDSSRTIILAVIQAGNDIDTQGIIQRARRFDKAGERTIGIITKPDLINEGTEARVASVAKNMDRTKLKLGFFLLKNPSPLQLQDGISGAERAKMEADFFSDSPWKEQNLDKTRVGVERLRYFLQDLLDSHIERELPKVRKEVNALLLDTENQLVQIGPERSNATQIRMFLTQKSMDFYNVTKAGVEGNYDSRDADFFSSFAKRGTRLRAHVHRENEAFAASMRECASKRKIRHDPAPHSEQPMDSDESQSSNVSAGTGQLLVTKEEMIEWVKTVYDITRGRELPGNYNHILLSELFHEQSSLWENVARQHLQTISSTIERFIRAALEHVFADEHVRKSVRQRLQRSIDASYEDAKEELKKLLLDEQAQPITYNHYYTDNIQNARKDAAQKSAMDSIEQGMAKDQKGKSPYEKIHLDLQKISLSLKTQVVVDMAQQACLESLTALDAYYKVAMKTFVDNVCRQVIERHILNGVTKAFNPVTVSQYTEDEILKIASETAQVRTRRSELQALKQALEESIYELQD